tara:strand:- start:3893 stop:4480 length:588 start_codon:yes stop_codon:yes gene_type:complete
VKLNKNIKKYLALSLITIGVSIISCDFDKNKKDTYLFNTDLKKEKIKTNIEEGKVLSEVAILNETILKLSELALTKDGEYSVYVIANKLKKDNTEIKNSINELAKAKLIILPNGFNKADVNRLLLVDEDSFSKAYLNRTGKLLEREIARLEYLSSITNDLDFKVLIVKYLMRLNHDLDQLNKKTIKLLTIKNSIL